MLTKLFRLYNQNLEKFTSNFCSWYNIFHIIQIQWRIQVDNDYIVKTSELAEKEWVYNKNKWATFSSMYKFFERAIKKYYDIEVETKTYSAYSDKFERMLKDWYAFWIGLKYWWRFWRNARKDQKLTILEARQNSEDFEVYGHALTYYYSKRLNKYYIIDSLWTSRKAVEMDIEVLREAIDNKLFFINARTLKLKDELLDLYLKFFKNWWKIDRIEDYSKLHIRAIEKAIKLLW